MSEYTEKTQFSVREVEFLFDMFQQAVALSHEPVNYIVIEQFQAIFPKIIPEWDNRGLGEVLFEDFDRNKTGKVELNLFIFGMHRVRKGNLEQQLHYCFSLFSKDFVYDRKAFSTALDTYLRLHTRETDEAKRKMDIADVVNKAFEHCNKPNPEDTITFDEIVASLLPTQGTTFIDIFGVGSIPNLTDRTMSFH